jgi:hypothetical protein
MFFLNEIYGNIVLNEYEDDTNYEYYEEYNNLEYEVFNNIASHKKIEFGGKIDPKQYHTALKKFIKMGELSNFPEKKIFDWKDMVIEHIWLLKIFTEINGHSDGYPVDTFMDIFNGDSTFSDWVQEKNEEAGQKLYSSRGGDWGSFIAFLEEEYNLDELLPTFANGQLLVSDYGLEPLLNLAYELHSLTDPSEILVCINKILDVTHQRSDLAELFVYGGSKELDFIHDYMGEELNEKWYGQFKGTKFKQDYYFDIFINPVRKELMEMNGTCRGIVAPNGDIYTTEDLIHYDLHKYLIENKIINSNNSDFDAYHWIDVENTNLLFLQNVGRNNIYDFYLSESYPNNWKVSDEQFDYMVELRDKCLEKNPMFKIHLDRWKDT